jgi:hypothetical protein
MKPNDTEVLAGRLGSGSAVLLPRLYERDIDVLLQEELLFNPAVVDVFSASLGLSVALRITDCRLSVVNTTGETDVLASFETREGRGTLLIENKIDAAFQPRQPERYRERATILGAALKDSAFCVLVAPKHYIYDSNPEFDHFDAIVSCEEVAQAMRSDDTARGNHRTALLLRAVEQARSAYSLVPAPKVTELWQRIHRIADSEFPALAMRKPGEKGGGSVWVVFKADLPPKVTIDWKITAGTVDLSFWGSASVRPKPTMDLAGLSADVGNLVSIQRLGRAGDTIAIRAPVPIAPPNFVEINDDTIRQSLLTASTLHRFYRNNTNSFV